MSKTMYCPSTTCAMASAGYAVHILGATCAGGSGALVVVLNRPAEGWRDVPTLIAEHPEAFTVGFQGDDAEYGPVCQFCGNRSAVCRCG